MPIRAVCPQCQSSFTLGDAQAGKRVRCTQCQGTFTVPGKAPSRSDVVMDVEVVEDEPPRSPPPAKSKVVRAEVVEEVEVVEEASSSRVDIGGPSRSQVRRGQPAGKTRITSARGGKAAPTIVRKGKPRDEDEDFDEPRRPRKKGGGGSKTPLLVGGIIAGLAVLLIGGGVLAVVLMRDKPASTEQVANTNTPGPSGPQFPGAQNPGLPPGVAPMGNVPGGPGPVVNPTPVTPNPVDTPPPPPVPETRTDKKEPDKAKPDKDDEEDNPPARAGNGTLGETARQRVKKATVLIRVTNADGSRASGSGFFGALESRNLVLTNAHVVGMLAPESPRPTRVEVVINSGENDERVTTARVLGVDRTSDLAILDVGTTDNMPEPLRVKPAKGLHELDQVFVFGFPLGEALGKEITIRPSSVSSLRKKNGSLDRIQVNGGMDPGNSGGPVVDNSGSVVGVAVSGIEGRQINFAIPGEHVQSILSGRIAEFGFGIPYHSGSQIGLPVTMGMIDPRAKIKEVAVDVWTGDDPRSDKKKAVRPPAVGTAPPAQEGDSQHMRYNLSYRRDVSAGMADIVLPALPPGKVYWHQPTWVNATGERHWVAATVLNVKPEEAVERTAAQLTLRYQRGNRPVTVTSLNTFRIGSDDDDGRAVVKTKVWFTEQVLQASNQGGANLALHYRKAEHSLIRPGKPTLSSRTLQEIESDLPNVSALLEVDSVGNLTKNELFIDMNKIFASHQRKGRMPDLQKLSEKIKKFHMPIQDGLEATSIKLPGGQINPGQVWTARRSLPIDKVGTYENGEIEMTYTYVGQRKEKGRDQAVINLTGIARGRGKRSDSIGGRATGRATVDIQTGQMTMVEVKVTVDLEINLKDPGGDDDDSGKTIKVIADLVTRLDRTL